MHTLCPGEADLSDATRLLACDLDGTVIPLEDGDEHRAGLSAFRAAVEGARGLRLAYVTGRHFEHALEGVQEHGLPRPDYLISEVGTVIHVFADGPHTVDEEYRRAMAEALGVDMDRVRTGLAEHPDLELQPAREQGDFKASYFTAWPVPEAVVGDLVARLDGMGARASLVVSQQVETGRGLIDALPAGVAKHRAVAHVAEREGLGPDRVCYAGDSGNDRAALLSGVYAVVVGNAPEYLVEDLRREASRRGLDGRIHFARAFYTAGVLEGCRRFGVL